MDKTELSEDDVQDFASYIDEIPEVRLQNPIDMKYLTYFCQGIEI